MGGISNGLPSREFFLLDLSQPFDATTPPWKDLTTTSPLPVLISWAKAINPPAFQGVAPETRRDFASVSDPLTGKLYIHGGAHDFSIPTRVFFNDFFILDGNNLSWSQIGKTGPNIPPSRIDHAAVLIANGVIVFIGGREYSITPKASLTAVPMNKLTLYDTKADTWDLMTTVDGLDIETRIGHTAVYAANGQIIVYGGITPDMETAPTPELAVLDTTTKPFKWITPPLTTPEAPINSLAYHQANLIGDYMNLQELSSFNDASSPTHSTQMTSSPPPSSQDQINNNDNFMRSISITTSPSLISSSNSQSPSNHNSQLSNTMDPNLQSGLERSTPDLNNIPINQTCINISTTNQLYPIKLFKCLCLVGQSSKEFFSLDLSQTFDATTPPCKDLTATFPLLVLIS
nr:12889_t:CDS:2 [Entrophospora candida]